MIFEVTPDQISHLDERELVDLLRRCAHAELAKHGIPISSGTVPAQIHIPDGGEDGRVEWTGPPNQTDFFPNRFNILQVKKSDLSPGQYRNEVLKKGTGKNSSKPEINDALRETIGRNGAYIVVTGSPVVGSKRTVRLNSIKTGLQDAGFDPSLLTGIFIYDCNNMADWVNTHPSVALYLNSMQRRLQLHGFRSFEDFHADSRMKTPAFQNHGQRYVARGTRAQKLIKQSDSLHFENNLDAVRGLLDAHLTFGGRAVRVFGASGFGKTRFIHALIQDDKADFQEFFDFRRVIYCEYDEVSDRLVSIARDIANSGSRVLLIVDDCPDNAHTRLVEIVSKETSNAILVSVNVETKCTGREDNLVIELKGASETLIKNIAGAYKKDLTRRDIDLIQELSQGYPRMAIIAADAADSEDVELASIDSLVERILWGSSEPDEGALLTLQLLSLFTVLGVDGQRTAELQQVADFAKREQTEMFREIQQFAKRGVIARTGDYAEVQPIPLAMRLANQWLEEMPRNALEDLFWACDDELQLRIVGRLRWLSWSDRVQAFAEATMRSLLPDEAALNTDFGSNLMDRLVHLAPDPAMAHLNTLLGGRDANELSAFNKGRRHTVGALEKLVFRADTFEPAATLLLELATAENENWGNNASGQFITLYQLYLSGTEALPEARLRVLDRGLASNNTAQRALCVKALEKMLTVHHFSRGGGNEIIGAGEKLEDWQPATDGEIWDFYRQGIQRLREIALDKCDPLAEEALTSISQNLRGLFSISNLFDDLSDAVEALTAAYPRWWGALEGVNSWLYFDRDKAPAEYQAKMRSLYDQLLPENDIEKILAFASGWAGHFHNPDETFDCNGENDRDYNIDQLRLLVQRSPADSGYFVFVAQEFLTDRYNSAQATVFEICKHVNDPENVISQLMRGLDFDDANPRFIANLCNSGLRGAVSKSDYDPSTCIDLVLYERRLEKDIIIALCGIPFDNSLFDTILDIIAKDRALPGDTWLLAFRDTLRAVDFDRIQSLMGILGRKGSEGAWARVKVLNYYLREQGALTVEEANLIKEAITSSQLMASERITNMDDYYWERLAGRLFADGFVDEGFALRLTQWVIALVDVKEYNVQLSFSKPAKNVLRKLAGTHPEIVWALYQQRREESDGIVGYRLRSLFGADFEKATRSGILADIPQEIVIPWMLENKVERIHVVLEWMPVLSSQEGQNTSGWSDDFLRFAEQYVDHENQLRVVHERLASGVWSGPYASRLEWELERVEALLALVKNPAVRSWALRLASGLRSEIPNARRDDDNRSASFRA